MGHSHCFSMSCVMLGEKRSFVLLKNLLVQKGQENLEAEGMETSFSYQGKWDFPWNHKDEACSLAAKSVFLFESNAQMACSTDS